MKRVIRFSKFFLPAAIISILIVVLCVVGFIIYGGFNLGVDFQAGLMQEVQFAPSAFSISWSGTSNAILSFDRGNIYIVISGAGVENRTYPFPFNDYRTIGSLTQAITSQVDGINISLNAPASINSQWLVFSTQGNPYLAAAPYIVHYLNPDSPAIHINDIRDSMASLGQGISVQNLGEPQARMFMIRAEDKADGAVKPEQIIRLLESHFGAGEVVALRSDYVGSRFSKDLTDQAGILIGLTLLIILVYVSIRFKPQYAAGAVLAIVHDAVVIVTFVLWTRMEFTTSTIAVILTILGYSINNTIVVFDRVRESKRIFPNDQFVDILNKSLSATLSRTIITTLTTMLAVLFLFIFTTGSMQDFALALIVGLICGVYTTSFIATGFVYFWEQQKLKKQQNKVSKPK